MEKQNKILTIIIVLGICVGIALFVKYDNTNKENTKIANIENTTNTTENTEKIETKQKLKWYHIKNWTDYINT